MNRDIQDTEHQAYQIKRFAEEQEKRVRKLDRGLADKLKKVGDAAGEVRETHQRASGPDDGLNASTRPSHR